MDSSAELRQQSFEFFRKLDLVMRRAQASGSPLVLKMAAPQGLESSLMKWLRKACRGEGVTEVPAMAVDLLAKFWKFQLNDKFVEDALKGMREVETRDDTKKHLRRVVAWQTPTNLGLASSYERPEVKISSASVPPAEFELAKCFSMTAGGTLTEEEKEELMMLADVRVATPTWHTHTPASEQERFADLAVLVDLHDRGSFAMAAETWKSALVPEHEFVSYEGVLYFCVRKYARAALVWPAKRVHGCLVELDMSVSKLQFLVVYCLTDLLIYKSRVLSPGELFLQEKSVPGLGVELLQPGLTAEQFHTDNCWAGLSGATLRCVFQEYDLAEPLAPESETGDDVELALAVDLSCKFNPEVAEGAVVAKLMAQRYSPGDLSDLPELDLQWLEDSSLDKDAKTIAEWYKEHEQKKVKAKGSLEQLVACVKECWSKSKGYTGPKPKTKAASAAKVAAASGRLYARLTDSADAFLRAVMPNEAALFSDPANGRWRLTFRPTHAQRSISWTRAGSQAAACLALRWAWEQKFAHDGTPMPPEADDACKRAEAAVAAGG